MNQLVPGCHNHSPGNIGIFLSSFVRDMRGGFTDKFQISLRGIIDETIIDEIIERQSIGIPQNVIANPIMSSM